MHPNMYLKPYLKSWSDSLPLCFLIASSSSMLVLATARAKIIRSVIETCLCSRKLDDLIDLSESVEGFQRESESNVWLPGYVQEQ